MRVAFISPHNDRCYGLRTIASFLREQGHEVWLLCFKRFASATVPEDDAEAWERIRSATYPPVIEPGEIADVSCPYLHPATENEWQLLLGKLADIRPDVVGLTVPTSTYDVACEITKRIRRELPGVPIVWGGPHATLCPEECLQTADMAAIGERSGLLPQALGRVSDLYGRQVEKVERILWDTALPLAVVALGALVLVVDLAMFRGLMRMAESILETL